MEEFCHYKPPSSHFPLCERRRYDVFLSFRGPDVRKTLADHLYQSLSTAGLNVFIDSERLEKGENIEMSLQQAIQNSTIFIPIFSPHYASSVWCLREVYLMWKLKSVKTHILIPLFYKVKPSDVRYAGDTYAEAFNKHAENKRYTPDVIQGWKNVLREVTSLSGWSLEETAFGYEGKLVAQVVKDVLQSLDTGMLEVAKYSVGLQPRSREVRELLKLGDETCDKLTLGIWGMPGLGKTNLAKALYNEIRHLFQASSYVSNVNLEGSLNGRITKLQGQILKDLLRIDMKVNDVDHGKTVMRSHLASIKALVVLDDVQNEWQLDPLLGDWFGKGSRIIINTPDKRVLDLGQADVIYSMGKLEHDEALELFSWHAFHTANPKRDYVDMTERIVKSCSGLPLSLEIVGRDLYKRDDIRYWSEVLNRLENVGQYDPVFEILKISYNNLSPVEKHIFLDIACFFVDIEKSDFNQNRAFSKDFYATFWSTLGCESVFTSLERLKEKSFILMDEQRYNEDMDNGLDCLGDGQYLCEFSMHDEIRDMGRRIVREESRSDPTKRSRVWREEDIRTLMAATKCQANKNVEGLVWRRRMELKSIESLASLQKLGFLMWWELQVETEIKVLPTNLKYLVLSECRLEMTRKKSGKKRKFDYIGSSISQANVKIERTLSQKFSQMAGNSSNRGVHEFPVFSQVLPNSIAQLVYLKYLDMSGTEQSCLPAEICKLHSLEELYVRRCGLKALPEGFECLIRLRFLDVSDNFLSEFPTRFDLLESLVNLEMARNKQLVVFPALPVNLTVLNARGCSKLQLISLNNRVSRLKTIDLSHCECLTGLSGPLGCKSLRDLRLDGCKELVELRLLPQCVASIRTTGCSKLQTIYLERASCYSVEFPCPVQISSPARSLKELHMIGCDNIRLNMFQLLKGFPPLEQLDPSLSVQISSPVQLCRPAQISCHVQHCRPAQISAPVQISSPAPVQISCHVQHCRPAQISPPVQISSPAPVQISSPRRDCSLKELHMIGCDNIRLNMFQLLKDFPLLEQLHLSLSSEVADELQPSIGEKNLTLHSLSYDTCLVAFFCFVTEGEENVRLPQMEVLMTYLEDVSGSLISKTFEVPWYMKGDRTGRVIMRACIWQMKTKMKRGMASCSYSVRHTSSKLGSEMFLRQVEFVVLKGKTTSGDSIQLLDQWELLSSRRCIHYEQAIGF